MSNLLYQLKLKPLFSPLSASPFLNTSLVVISQEQMNTHENKMPCIGHPATPKSNLTFVLEAKSWVCLDVKFDL